MLDTATRQRMVGAGGLDRVVGEHPTRYSGFVSARDNMTWQTTLHAVAEHFRPLRDDRRGEAVGPGTEAKPLH